MPQRPQAVVFDLYGTLYDVHSVSRRCDAACPGRGMEISVLWRQKQLEYTWLRSLMGQYIPFEEVTRDALVHACRQLGLAPDPQTLDALSEAYLDLAPHPEAPGALQTLRDMGLPLAILSNGSSYSIGRVVSGSGLKPYFSHILSVEAARVFKPHPAVYTLACQALQLPAGRILFVSSNAWDAAGARHFGFQVCWADRQGSGTFDELGAAPDAIVARLDELPALMDRP